MKTTTSSSLKPHSLRYQCRHMPSLVYLHIGYTYKCSLNDHHLFLIPPFHHHHHHHQVEDEEEEEDLFFYRWVKIMMMTMRKVIMRNMGSWPPTTSAYSHVQHTAVVFLSYEIEWQLTDCMKANLLMKAGDSFYHAC